MGRSKPGWGKPDCKPIWWPQCIPWANVRSDVRSSHFKSQVDTIVPPPRTTIYAIINFVYLILIILIILFIEPDSLISILMLTIAPPLKLCH